MEYWKNTERYRRLFFCQIEALETLIYVTEVAHKYGDQVITNDLRRFAADANPDLYRIACKMATGSGKTVVMGMVIAWHTLNKLAYRDLWLRIRDDLPKKGRGKDAVSGEPRLPDVLEGALQSLYSNYQQYYERWQTNEAARADGLTPPVFIVVCNNTNVSKMVFDYIAGWEKILPDGVAVAVPGRLEWFSNVQRGADRQSQFAARPNTILVDSQQLESGEAMSPDFKKIASREIDEFKTDDRTRFPGRDVDSLADEDLLHEVMNTVGNKKKEAKTSTAETFWVPAVNNAGDWGRWRFLEIDDPWDAKNSIRTCLSGVIK